MHAHIRSEAMYMIWNQHSTVAKERWASLHLSSKPKLIYSYGQNGWVVIQLALPPPLPLIHQSIISYTHAYGLKLSGIHLYDVVSSRHGMATPVIYLKAKEKNYHPVNTKLTIGTECTMHILVEHCKVSESTLNTANNQQ